MRHSRNIYSKGSLEPITYDFGSESSRTGCGRCLDGQKAGIALGHRRLSILELSDAAPSPCIPIPDALCCPSTERSIIISNCGKSLGPCPGAVKRTRNPAGRHGSLGPGKTLRCVGMLAFALWDTWERRLSGQDRMGESLYYGRREMFSLCFGTEGLAPPSCF